MEEDYKEKAFIKLLESTSNRRIIQHLRLRLFKETDFPPEKLDQLNLRNSKIEKDLFLDIKTTASLILDELEKQVYIYNRYFRPLSIEGLRSNILKAEVRGYLLKGEEYLFGWEIFYLEYLAKFLNDKDRLEEDPIGYYQKIYEYIVYDMTYDDKYECYH